MTHKEWHEGIKEFTEDALSILASKNQSYSTLDDPLANFKETAAFLKVTPEQALLPLLHKHYRAIVNAVQGGHRPPADSLIDVVNYISILHIMGEDT